jgi:hypothetical protein
MAYDPQNKVEEVVSFNVEDVQFSAMFAFDEWKNQSQHATDQAAFEADRAKIQAICTLRTK